jgi:hypothetical protein
MSTLRVNTIQDSTGSSSPAINGLAKAWVNFNGTGTVAIRASLNVSSITDNGTGIYQVNFTNAFSDTNYSFHGAARNDLNNRLSFQMASNSPFDAYGDKSTTWLRFYTGTTSGILDSPEVCVAVFR